MSSVRFPKQPGHGASRERAVRLPDQLKTDRRATTRYKLTLAVRYVVHNWRGGVATTGLGQTVDLSSGGVRFTADSPLPPGLRVKLFIDWPALLDGTVELQLTIDGTVVRSGNDGVSLRIEKHGFRTRGRGMKTA